MQQHFDLATIKNWDRFYRTHFVNSLSGFKSVSLIGTVNKKGQTNLAIFCNIVHVGADPALIGFINRPIEAAPHTIKNIEATNAYTINHIDVSMIDAAHQTSAKYAAGESEFDAVGLTAEWKTNCQAPFVLESKVKYSLTLVEIIPIAINKTFLVIGALQDVYVEEQILQSDGFLQIEKVHSVCSLGIDGYYETNLLKRLPYAKVK